MAYFVLGTCTITQRRDIDAGAVDMFFDFANMAVKNSIFIFRQFLQKFRRIGAHDIRWDIRVFAIHFGPYAFKKPLQAVGIRRVAEIADK